MSRRSVLIESLEATPRDLARMLRRLDDAAARWRPAPGEWCAADVVAHLAYIEAPYLARLRRVVEQDNPFEPYLHPDESAHDLARPLAELLDEFVRRRAETVAFLQGLEQRDWGRPLVHATIGATKLRDQVQELVSHDNTHLAQLVSLREQLKPSAS
ncbi:MAG TPA: DinB family protein [Kouleothrix sp.]|uniref:DinB family protein n=1 Tax=Kouleothrix sp. TaxID=2779161 RepID=UPI002B6CCB8F|nr:DinB family protein [Kouleothrix sp.]